MLKLAVYPAPTDRYNSQHLHMEEKEDTVTSSSVHKI